MDQAREDAEWQDLFLRFSFLCFEHCVSALSASTDAARGCCFTSTVDDAALSRAFVTTASLAQRRRPAQYVPRSSAFPARTARALVAPASAVPPLVSGDTAYFPSAAAQQG